MTSPETFHNALTNAGVRLFTGVPDSLLKEYCAYVDAVMGPESHVISANEGSAVAIAAGFYLGTGQLPLVYMQNSGLGNAVNPLLSLVDPEVYSLPIVVLVGWRGAPGISDEPQHLKQGRVTPAMLDAMESPWMEIGGTESSSKEAAIWATETAISSMGPVVLLAHKGAFTKSESKRPTPISEASELSREMAIETIAQSLPKGSVVVSTTGMASRELYETRMRTGTDPSRDFLTVGSMGHASQIALGVALSRPDLEVYCIDGDGAALMHLGGMATIGTSGLGNLTHILLNNGVHDSVGGQPTVANKISLTEVSSACRYSKISSPVTSAEGLTQALMELSNHTGPKFLEVKLKPGSRGDLGRPKESPSVNKNLLMNSIASSSKKGD